MRRRTLTCALAARVIGFGILIAFRGNSGLGAARFAFTAHDGVPSEGHYTSGAKIDARFLTEDFTLDGDLTKSAWKSAKWVEFDHDMSGRRSYPEARTRVATLWSANSVYFAFSCRYLTLNTYPDDDATKERWELWNRDVVEVFVNPQPERLNHYFEFEVSPNNQWIDLEISKDRHPFNDASWDSHFLHATRVDTERRVWTCEMRIPVESLGVPAISVGGKWRVNLFRADGPGSDAERRFLAWSTIPEGTTFHVPSRFGVLAFIK
ncbi:MAG TPA: carbohydrate-binding family 9-like protein [Terriglobia bacterium]|nr:carbohydrate-binding family 9-like protein [Terriglobia bacterium]